MKRPLRKRPASSASSGGQSFRTSRTPTQTRQPQQRTPTFVASVPIPIPKPSGIVAPPPATTTTAARLRHATNSPEVTPVALPPPPFPSAQPQHPMATHPHYSVPRLPLDLKDPFLSPRPGVFSHHHRISPSPPPRRTRSPSPQPLAANRHVLHVSSPESIITRSPHVATSPLPLPLLLVSPTPTSPRQPQQPPQEPLVIPAAEQQTAIITTTPRSARVGQQPPSTDRAHGLLAAQAQQRLKDVVAQLQQLMVPLAAAADGAPPDDPSSGSLVNAAAAALADAAGTGLGQDGVGFSPRLSSLAGGLTARSERAALIDPDTSALSSPTNSESPAAAAAARHTSGTPPRHARLLQLYHALAVRKAQQDARAAELAAVERELAQRMMSGDGTTAPASTAAAGAVGSPGCHLHQCRIPDKGTSHHHQSRIPDPATPLRVMGAISTTTSPAPTPVSATMTGVPSTMTPRSRPGTSVGSPPGGAVMTPGGRGGSGLTPNTNGVLITPQEVAFLRARVQEVQRQLRTREEQERAGLGVLGQLRVREAALGERESLLGQRVALAESRSRLVAQREAESAREQAELEAHRAALQSRLEETQLREEELQARETALADQRQVLAQAQVDLTATRAADAQRLTAAQQQLDQREHDLDARARRLDEASASCTQREAALRQRDEAARAQAGRLADLEARLAERQEEVR
ncbi:hypothetical protein PAPYR_9264 [Paratrimastix pyriformis]|uniref:Uncharacterized protein n=1 Tax=Paratrimastix pyriformis TaxID=342808 RepID=A0ABQ8UBI4_9EUKA|nr:hypothetical protein PAPYR_9264 [Paratrimastix pyriformis]